MPLKKLCERVGMSRQNFYKSRKIRGRKHVDEQLIKTLVEEERGLQPRIGGLKLHQTLRGALSKVDIKIGRDRFFKVLGNQGLLLDPLPKAPRTTNSNHGLHVYGNLIKDVEPSGPNQIWVSDITYIRTFEGFGYLSLIMDMFSRKIVGYHFAETMEAMETRKALKMALANKPKDAHPIHHSDRGSQYCSRLYVKELKKHGMAISMTEENHCAENSMAERLNGILKQEYALRCEFRTFRHARSAVKGAVYLYNTRRLHRSLNLQTPEQVHRAVA